MSDDLNTQQGEQIETTQEDNEFKDKYLRALADYQNLEKQTQVWKDSYSAYATQGIIRNLLEVLDDLEKAQEHIKDEGLQLVINKLKIYLKAEGLLELELLGKEFDPNEAEVVSTKPGEKNNVIVEVLQKGYRLKDKIIRPAKVVVSTVN